MAVARRRHIYSILDGKGKTGVVIIHSDHVLDADAGTFNDNVKIALEGLITGTIEEWGLYTSRGVDPTNPAVNSDRQEKGAFTFKDDDTFAMLVSVPTFDEGLIIAGTDNINLSAPAVSAFVSLMVADGTTARAIGLDSILKGKEVFK